MFFHFNPRTPGGVRPPAFFSVYPAGHISIHAPRVGCDVYLSSTKRACLLFQSTHPGWGATLSYNVIHLYTSSFQSTHPGWGATPRCLGRVRCKKISIHAPRVGCDQKLRVINTSPYLSFQSTHPGWGATPEVDWLSVDQKTFQSTHPGWGATQILLHICERSQHFNPRTPGGVRLTMN